MATKSQIISDLNEFGISFDPKAKKADLETLLNEHLDAMLDAEETPTNPQDDGKVWVSFSKGKKGIEQVNAASIAPVRPIDLVAAGNALRDVALNLLAGRLDPAIKKAAESDKAKDLKELLSGAPKNEVTYLRKLVSIPAARLRADWEQYVNDAKRVHGVSLSGMVKASIPKGEGNENKRPLKDRLMEAWDQIPPELQTDARMLPLSDLISSIEDNA